MIPIHGLTGQIDRYPARRVQIGGPGIGLGIAFEEHGLTLVIIGLAIGLAASLAAGKVLESLLFATGPADPLTLAAVALALAIAGTIACLGPAWRATGVDPMLALRAD